MKTITAPAHLCILVLLLVCCQQLSYAQTRGSKTEVGFAERIDNVPDSNKYIALHPSVPIGTVLKVHNTENNVSVFVRVIGQLPKVSSDPKLIVRLSPTVFEGLKVSPGRRRISVELSYVENTP